MKMLKRQRHNEQRKSKQREIEQKIFETENVVSAQKGGENSQRKYNVGRHWKEHESIVKRGYLGHFGDIYISGQKVKKAILVP